MKSMYFDPNSTEVFVHIQSINQKQKTRNGLRPNRQQIINWSIIEQEIWRQMGEQTNEDINV